MNADSGKAPKIAILLRLLTAIDEGRCSFEDLKVRLDPERPPGTRTMRRYLAELAAAGFPWYYDRAADAYKFDQDYSLRRMRLSEADLLGLLTLRGIATSLGGDLSASIEGFAEKLGRVTDRSANAAVERPSVRLQLAGPQLDPERNAIFTTLQRAQRERQSVRFDYVDKRGSSTKRHVDPYGFVVSSGRMYLVAHDRHRGAKRVFALDAVTEAKIAPQRFTMPADFDIEAFAARSVSGIMHADADLLVTVRYSSVVARAAKADRVVRERRIEERPDGSVDVTYTVSDGPEFARWTLKWGPEAEILMPPEVRRDALETARTIVARYEPHVRRRRRKS